MPDPEQNRRRVCVGQPAPKRAGNSEIVKSRIDAGLAAHVTWKVQRRYDEVSIRQLATTIGRFPPRFDEAD